MGFYADHIEPAVVSFACASGQIKKQRAAIIPQAEGRVLEIGFGSGHNAPFYDADKVSHLFALEPSAAMRKRAAPNLDDFSIPMDWLDLPGEEIPLDDKSVDTVVVAFTLCTIPDTASALAGMRRVLKPGGRLLFVEHGRAPDAGIAKWQDRLNGVWGKIGGGCNLNREPLKLISQAGFDILDSREGYIKKAPKIAGFVTSGIASR